MCGIVVAAECFIPLGQHQYIELIPQQRAVGIPPRLTRR